MEISELNDLYREYDTALQSHFAEQRSNVRMVAGFHYRNSAVMSRFRDRTMRSSLPEDQKIRITKNHIQVCDKRFVNSILTYLPGVGIYPRNEDELQDIKCAELSRSAWEYGREDNDFEEFTQGIVEDYFRLGEIFTFTFFDPHQGKFLGFDVTLDALTGIPVSEPIARHQGKVIIKRIPGFNVLTSPNAKTWEENPCTIFRFHYPTADLEARYKGDKKKLEFITETKDETYQVFDALTGEFRTSKGMTMIRQYFYRPCSKYPKGAYYYATEKGILEEGDLSLGYPIEFAANEKSSTSFRGKSPIRHAKANQVEINRCANQIVTHQITLGDDKVFVQGGIGKFSPPTAEPGVRIYNHMGQKVDVIQGRTGDQYLPWLNYNIDEIYRILMVDENDQEKTNSKDEVYAMLYKSMKEKKRFVIHSNKIEKILKRVCSFYLDNARTYWSDDMMIPVVGKNEYVNIPEFRNSQPIHYMIKVLPQSEDYETVLGKSLQITQFLQYAGSQLNPEQLGLLLRHMPFLNKEPAFKKLTQDMDNAENDELALDRGEIVPVNENDNHEYLVKELIGRTKRKDFRLLPQQLQKNYYDKIALHNQAIARKQHDLALANAGAIPTGGPLVKCYIYLPDPLKPDKQELVKIPIEALNWLIKKLEQQGFQQNAFMQLPDDVKASVGRILAQSRQPQPLVQPAQNEFELTM